MSARAIIKNPPGSIPKFLLPNFTGRAFAAKRLYIIVQGFSPGLSVAEIRPESTSNLARRGAIRRRQSKDCLRSDGRGALLGSSRVIPSPRPTSGATFRAPFTNQLTQG